MTPQNLTKRLALAIENRGRDATGYAYAGVGDYEGDVLLHKLPIAATPFTRQGHHTSIQRGTNTVLIHTRAATTGDPADNDNNHPIVVQARDTAPGLVGIHNGVLMNDTYLWRKYDDLAAEKVGEVDSQLIFQLMSRKGRDSLNELDGDASIAWIDMAEPTKLQVARMGGRPLFGVTTKGGSFFFASTDTALVEALRYFHPLGVFAKKDMTEFVPGDWVTVEAGEVIETGNDFPVISLAKSYHYSSTTISRPRTAVQHTPAVYDEWDDDPVFPASYVPTDEGGDTLPFGLSPTDRATWEASMEAAEASGEPSSTASSDDDRDTITRFDREFFHFLTQGIFLGVHIEPRIMEAIVELAYTKADGFAMQDLLDRFTEPVNQLDVQLTRDIADFS